MSFLYTFWGPHSTALACWTQYSTSRAHWVYWIVHDSIFWHPQACVIDTTKIDYSDNLVQRVIRWDCDYIALSWPQCQQSFLGCWNSRRPWMVIPRQLNPEVLTQGINQGQKLGRADPSGSSCLTCGFQVNLRFWPQRKTCWQGQGIDSTGCFW